MSNITLVRRRGNLKGIFLLGRDEKLHYYLTKEVTTMDEANELINNDERVSDSEQEQFDQDNLDPEQEVPDELDIDGEDN